jgi:hypothetical protein
MSKADLARPEGRGSQAVHPRACILARARFKRAYRSVARANADLRGHARVSRYLAMRITAISTAATERAGANPWALRRPARERGREGELLAQRPREGGREVVMAAVGVRRALVSAARSDRPTEEITRRKRGTPVRHVDVARARRHLGCSAAASSGVRVRAGSVRTGCAHVGRRGRGPGSKNLRDCSR